MDCLYLTLKIRTRILFDKRQMFDEMFESTNQDCHIIISVTRPFSLTQCKYGKV